MKNIIIQALQDDDLIKKINNPFPKPTHNKYLITYLLPDYDYNEQLLIYVPGVSYLYLCKLIKEEPAILTKNGATKVNRHLVYTDISNVKFGKFEVLEYLKLKKKITFPQQDKTYFVNKPIHSRLHTDLIQFTDSNIVINKYLSNDDILDEGVIAYKDNNDWGFLYYEKSITGDYNFNFQIVNNVVGGKRLIQTDEGYKDFTYFIKTNALPKAIKIGRAENPDSRFATIQAYNARDIVTELITADGRLETYFHAKYDYLRISDSKEWFEIDDDLLNFIKNENKKINYIKAIYEKYLKSKTHNQINAH